MTHPLIQNPLSCAGCAGCPYATSCPYVVVRGSRGSCLASFPPRSLSNYLPPLLETSTSLLGWKGELLITRRWGRNKRGSLRRYNRRRHATSRLLRKPNKSRWLLFRTHLLSDPLLCLGNRFTDVETAVRDDCLITHMVFADWMYASIKNTSPNNLF